MDISWKQYAEDMDKIIAAVKELPEDDGWGYSKKNTVPTVKRPPSNVSTFPVPEPRTSLDSKVKQIVASTSPVPEPRRSLDRTVSKNLKKVLTLFALKVKINIF